MTCERDDALRKVDDLLRRFGDPLFFKALVSTAGDRGEAQDLVQEVFKALWKARDKVLVLPDDQRQAWLFGVMQHKVIDRFRRGARREITVEPEQFAMSHLDRLVPSPTRQILVGELLDRCWEVIRRMSPTRRHVFWLRAHESTTTSKLSSMTSSPTRPCRSGTWRAG